MKIRLRIRLIREGFRLVDAEDREVWRILVLRKRDWFRAWLRARHIKRSLRFGVPSEIAEWDDIGVRSALVFALVFVGVMIGLAVVWPPFLIADWVRRRDQTKGHQSA
jgi:hypothetical protein